MQESIKRLKEKGIRITPQRLAVFNFLKKQNRHLTAEEIFQGIKKNFLGLSLATVYSILELFKKERLIQEIRIDFYKSCFEVKTGFHHHFFCKKCGKILDLEIKPCKHLKEKEVEGNIIEEFQGYFYGICKDCRENVKGRKS